MDEIRGLLTKVLAADPAGRWLFAEIRVDTPAGPRAYKAGFPNQDVKLGDYFVATGKWVEVAAKDRYKAHTKFQATTAKQDLPVTKQAAAAWLSAVFGASHGATPASIQAFVERHGDRVAHVCERNPETIVGVSANPAAYRAAILSEWGRRISGRSAERMLTEAGVAPKARGAIHGAFRDRTYEVITTDPYRASRVRNVGFGQADLIGRHTGIGPLDDRRVGAALVEVLTSFRQEGSTFAGVNAIGARLDALGIDQDTTAAYIARHAGVSDAPFVVERRDGRIVVALRELRDAERRVAARLVDLLSGGRRNHAPAVAAAAGALFATKAYDWADEVQKAAVRLSATEPVSILTGGPGTGKSTVSEVLVATSRKVDQGKILLCAPTGKAAKRLEETTKLPAVTIHRLLGARERQDGAGNDFKHGRSNPLPPGCLVVVDEASMVDVVMLAALLDAVPDDGRVVFVGDSNQLPSVDAGAALGDMLAARDAAGGHLVPRSELVTVYRQASKSNIAVGAAEVREGRLPFMTNVPDKGLVLYEHGQSDIVKRVRGFVEQVCVGRLGLSPSEFVILSPQARGTAGTWEINKVMSTLLNPGGAAIPGVHVGPDDVDGMPIPRVGDRVMLTKNDTENDVMNGDVGRIAGVRQAVSKDGGTRNAIRVEFDCGKAVEYPVSMWRSLILAYAMTIHKSQGSQYHTVIMPVTMAHESMLDRRLFYTGWTRAKEVLCLVGEREAIDHSVASVAASTRDTLLAGDIAAQAARQGLRGVPPDPSRRPPPAVAPAPARMPPTVSARPPAAPAPAPAAAASATSPPPPAVPAPLPAATSVASPSSPPPAVPASRPAGRPGRMSGTVPPVPSRPADPTVSAAKPAVRPARMGGLRLAPTTDAVGPAPDGAVSPAAASVAAPTPTPSPARAPRSRLASLASLPVAPAPAARPVPRRPRMTLALAPAAPLPDDAEPAAPGMR